MKEVVGRLVDLCLFIPCFPAFSNFMTSFGQWNSWHCITVIECTHLRPSQSDSVLISQIADIFPTNKTALYRQLSLLHPTQLIWPRVLVTTGSIAIIDEGLFCLNHFKSCDNTVGRLQYYATVCLYSTSSHGTNLHSQLFGCNGWKI